MPSFEELLARKDSKKIYTLEATLTRDDGLGGVESKTLLLTTHTIKPDRAHLPHGPFIKDIGSYRQSIQELRWGQSQRSYGRLKINNPDGKFKTELRDWNWQGNPIVTKLGFDELNTTEYRALSTCRMGLPQDQGGLISLPVVDYQIDFDQVVLPAGDYSDTVPNLVSTCLGAAGITGINSAAWNAWAAENTFTGNGFYRSSGDSVKTALERIVAPLPGWFSFNREGEFIIGTTKAPDAGVASLNILGDAKIMKFSRSHLARYWKIPLEYVTGTGSTITYATLTNSDSAIKSVCPGAQERTTAIRTVLTNSVDAQTVLDRHWALMSVQRFWHELQLKVQPALLNLHDQIYEVREKAGLDGNFRVMGFNEQRQKNRLGLELFE